MRQDCREKRASFIDSSAKIRECFDFAHPAEVIKATDIYSTTCYGSNLWDFKSKEFDMLVNAWRTGHKLAWAVPRGCRTFLVQEVLAPHVRNLRASLQHRVVSFFHGLLTSPSQEAKVVALLAARDIRSSLGSNLAMIQEETGLDPWVASREELWVSLEAANRVPVPPLDKWRVPALEKLLSARIAAHFEADQVEISRLQSLIDSLVIG